jgi:hypothetical protein
MVCIHKAKAGRERMNEKKKRISVEEIELRDGKQMEHTFTMYI